MKIIYEQDDNTVAVMAVNEFLLSFMPPVEAGKRFVPAGKRFKIIEDTDLPEEDLWEAWRVDFSDFDGIGGVL